MSKLIRFFCGTFLVFLFMSSESVFANSIPITMLSNSAGTASIQIDKLVELVKQQLINVPTHDIYEAKVQIIYNQQNNPDHLLVYWLSAKNYSFTVSKIKINSSYQVLAVENNYQLEDQDFAQQPQIYSVDENACPDKRIQFVTATPADYIASAKHAIEYVYHAAETSGYKTHKLLGREATIAQYQSLLACPNLLGFFNVGHGNPQGLILADGVLSSTMFSEKLRERLRKRAVLLFNSCKVHNDPLKNAVTEDAQAQKYLGGVTNLRIGPSELASQCFWDAAFRHQSMTNAIVACNTQFDPNDIFGVGGHGADLFGVAA